MGLCPVSSAICFTICNFSEIVHLWIMLWSMDSQWGMWVELFARWFCPLLSLTNKGNEQVLDMLVCFSADWSANCVANAWRRLAVDPCHLPAKKKC